MPNDETFLSVAGDLSPVVSVDLGGTQIRTAVQQGGKLLSRIGLLTGEDPRPDRVIPRMVEAVRKALQEANTSVESVVGIGIGAPGPLNNRTGVVFCPPNLPGWQNVRLRDIFSQHFALPIFVENDANTAALGEFMFGVGHGSEDIVYLTISTGIGGGVIANGRILEGVLGTAGEIGHMTIDWRGPRCNCGNIGCLESIASGTAIARHANERIVLGKPDSQALVDFVLAHPESSADANTPYDSRESFATPIHVNARQVAQAAQAGVPLARTIIQAAAEALGVGLVNIIHIFNPELIILGGGVSQMGEMLLEPARRIVRERAMAVPRDCARIVLAELGNDVGLIGAGALVYSHLKPGKQM